MIQNAIDNPYWEIEKHIPGNPINEKYERTWQPDWTRIGYNTREKLVRECSWAIPNPDALAFVAEHMGSRAVEIGAGTGYWASLLAQMGIDIICYDIQPPQHSGQNHWHSPCDEKHELVGETREVFYEVRAGSHLAAADDPDRTLFLCWPPYDDQMAFHVMDAIETEEG